MDFSALIDSNLISTYSRLKTYKELFLSIIDCIKSYLQKKQYGQTVE